MLDQAFEALKTFDWGSDVKTLAPIDEAIVASQGDAAARSELEDKLAAVLKTDAPRAAKDYVCRQLMIIGTGASVPTLAAMLSDKDDAQLARYALERIDAPEAAAAMRDAIPNLSGDLKIGVIGSLGVRQDVESIPALAALVNDSDAGVARAAAIALGDICTSDAAKALADAELTSASIDASLNCAEGLLASGDKMGALKIYNKLSTADVPKHVKMAATKGKLACMSR